MSNIKKRKNTDNNCFELICALCLEHPSIQIKEDFKNIQYINCKKLKGCNEEYFEKYKNDLEIRSNNIISSYINNFKQESEKYLEYPIEHIYLEGKNITSQEILELNNNINNKCAKADIYVKYINGQIIGISVKQDEKCTKSNYSVESIINNIVEPENRDLLKNIRKKLLKDEGFETFSKEQRQVVNSLFYPNKQNDYWDCLREHIINYNDSIKNKLIEYMYPIDLPYKLYEFNGKNIKEMNYNNCISEFYECKEYYYTTKNKLRNAAKLYYRLIVNNEIYRVEIRWKGTIHNASPQFQIHCDK